MSQSPPYWRKRAVALACLNGRFSASLSQYISTAWDEISVVLCQVQRVTHWLWLHLGQNRITTQANRYKIFCSSVLNLGRQISLIPDSDIFYHSNWLHIVQYQFLKSWAVETEEQSSHMELMIIRKELLKKKKLYRAGQIFYTIRACSRARHTWNLKEPESDRELAHLIMIVPTTTT